MALGRSDVDRLAGVLVAYVPWTVIGVSLLAVWIAQEGIWFVPGTPAHPLDPVPYVAGMLFHESWDHLVGNLRLWIPIGVVLTWLTSNRHVLGLIVAVQVLTQVVSMAVGRPGLGLSVAVFGVATATLVRATAIAARHASTDGLQVAVAGALVPVLGALLFLAVLVGGDSPIGHFPHFFGALFGGAIEAMYVLQDRQRTEREQAAEFSHG